MNKLSISQKQSDMLYVLKAFAILSVVTAHASVSDCTNTIVARLLGNFSTAGVCLFYILAGYFFDCSKGIGIAFIKKKTINIFIPWIISATVTYSLRFLTGGLYINLSEYLAYVFGYGSLYYYLTVLFVCFALYGVLGKNRVILYISIVISLVSIFLTAFEVIGIYPYLNPFNWCGFFAVGIILQKIQLDNISLKMNIGGAIIFGFCWIALTVLGMDTDYYWLLLSLLNELLLILFLYNLACLTRGVLGKVLRELGKLTLPVYLYHLPLVSQMPGGNSVLIVLSRILLTVAICFFVFFIIKKFAKGFLKKAIILLGIK